MNHACMNHELCAFVCARVWPITFLTGPLNFLKLPPKESPTCIKRRGLALKLHSHVEWPLGDMFQGPYFVRFEAGTYRKIPTPHALKPLQTQCCNGCYSNQYKSLKIKIILSAFFCH